MRRTERVVLATYRLVGGEPRAKLEIARHVGLIALVEMVAIGQMTSIRQRMVDTSDAIPEVCGPRDRDPDIGCLNRDSVEHDVVLNALIIRDGAIDIG